MDNLISILTLYSKPRATDHRIKMGCGCKSRGRLRHVKESHPGHKLSMSTNKLRLSRTSADSGVPSDISVHAFWGSFAAANAL